MRITKPGVYDIEIERYHNDPELCDGPSVSASVLHKMIAECPAKVWETSPLNPKRVPNKTTAALDIGRASHALTLGEPELARYFVVSPYDDFKTKEARAWRDAETRTVIKADVFETILAMADAQRRSPQVARAFVDGEPEKSLVWLDAETGIWIRSRPDWLPRDPTVRPIVDFKTARTIAPREMSSAAFVYGFHIQAAMQLDAVRAVLGIEPAGIAHVVQEKSIPYLAELRMFDGDGIEFGRHEYRRALRLFAECWRHHKEGFPERNAWPGYTSKPAYFDPPYWIRKEMEESYGNAKATTAAANRRSAPAGDEPGEFADALDWA